MMPKRAERRCPSCNQIPSANERVVLKCRCGGALVGENGVKGTPDMESHLEGYSFHYAPDRQGDEYYIGPASHIIHLYRDGTWDSDKAPAEWSLDKYLDWIRQLERQTATK